MNFKNKFNRSKGIIFKFLNKISTKLNKKNIEIGNKWKKKKLMTFIKKNKIIF